MFSSLAVILLLPLASVRAIGILFPLYVYPEQCTTASSKCTWQPLYNAVTANPAIKFTFIINPDNGPGMTGPPNSDYIPAIAQLNSFANVRTVGYIFTSNGKRAATGTAGYEADVATYASWSNYTAANIALDGIFVDEMADSSSTANQNYYTTLAAYVRSAFPSGSEKFLIFNPGDPVAQPFFALADIIVTFEDAWANTWESGTIFTDSSFSSTPRSQQAAIFNTFTGTATQQQNLTTVMANTENMAQIYVTTGSDYDTFSTLWSQFVAAIAAVN